MIQDFFDILSKCVASIDGGAFFGVVALALTLGVICWVACSYYTRLWNKRFRVKLQHHLLCAIAAIATVIFTVTFQAVGNLETIVDDIIDTWSEELVNDDEWSTQTYEIAFYTVKEEYPRAFAGVPEPGKKGSVIVFENDHARQLCVETYVTRACDNFSTLHPFLDKMLSARPGVSEEEIIDDIQSFFSKQNDVSEGDIIDCILSFFGKKNNEPYPLLRAVVIAAKHIRESLLEQSPKTVWKTRTILVFLFLAIQLLPFGTIGYCAYKDLHSSGNQTHSHQEISYDF